MKMNEGLYSRDITPEENIMQFEDQKSTLTVITVRKLVKSELNVEAPSIRLPWEIEGKSSHGPYHGDFGVGPPPLSQSYSS